MMFAEHDPSTARRGRMWAPALVAALVFTVLPSSGVVRADEAFILVDPENPAYYQRSITAGKHLRLRRNTSVEGHIHGNRDVFLARGAEVSGDVSAVQEVRGAGTASGDIREFVEPVQLPALPPVQELRNLADRVLTGRQVLRNATINDVLFIDGNVDVRGTLHGRGTLIVNGRMKVKWGRRLPDPQTLVSVIVLGRVDVVRGRTLRAVIRTTGDVRMNRDVDFTGLILANGKVDLAHRGRYSFFALDQAGPALTITSPASGAVLDTALPPIEAVWSDDLSGVDPRSAVVTVDGVDRSAEAITNSAGLLLVPAPFLTDGPHTVGISVADRVGNVSAASVSFEIDTEVPSTDDLGPDLAIVQPIIGSVLPTADFDIRLTYADADPGVALNTLVVALDGNDITARCLPSPDRAACVVTDVAAGEHTVTAEIKDRAGNRSSQSATFRVDLSSSDTTPPTLAFLSPPNGSIRDASPQVILNFSDLGSGVDTETLRVLLSGTEVTGCTTYPGSATCDLGELDPGSYSLTASLADRAGNVGSVLSTFTVDPTVEDPTPPQLFITAPNSPIVDQPDPEISLTYRDDESGIDEASLVVELDGVDLTAGCIVDSLLAVCPTSDLEAGQHLVMARVANGAGAESSAAFEFSVVTETVPPLIERVAPLGPVVTTATPRITYQYDDESSGIDLSSFVLQVGGVAVEGCLVQPDLASCVVGPLAAGPYTLEARLADTVGNVATLSEMLTVELEVEDTVAPQLTIVAPTEGAVIRGSSIAVQVTFEDGLSGINLDTLRIDVDGSEIDLADCNIGGGLAVCTAAGLAAGPHTLGAEIRDQAGNAASAVGSFETVLQAALTITSPASGFVTSEDTVDIQGTFEGVLDSVRVAGLEGLLGEGTYVVAGVPLHEGGNTLTAVARGADGSIGTATVQVVRDTEAPKVVIRSPADGFVSGASQLAVTGELIHPSSSSTAGRPVRVWVNGEEAEVESGTFALPDLRLTPGPNQIQVETEDAAGNRGFASIGVEVAAPDLARLEPLVILQEAGKVGEVLPTPLAVRAIDGQGIPLAGRTLRFEVTRGDGKVVSFPDEARSLDVVTDGNGIAEVSFRLGSRVGRGNHEVTVTSAGLGGAVLFCASAEGAAPRRIVPVVGSRHTATLVGAEGSPLPDPLLVRVFDELGNYSPGVDVTFRVVAGGGSLMPAEGIGGAGSSEIVITTDIEGRASAVWTLGAGTEIDGNIVEAVFPGLTETPATFLATGRQVGPESDTAIVGLVLDNQDAPVPGATISVLGHAGEVTSDAEGRFRLHPAPVGTVVLEVVGGTTPLPGTWPTLDFELTTVSGLDNTLGAPIRLLPLDDAGSKIVGGDQDVVLRMQGVAGAELKIFAGSTTFPDGSKTGRLSLTQVHGDKVPMQAPLGSNFMLAWSVQPAGVKFDPPAQISIPNLGSPAGSVVDIFSFDHDLGEFVPVGTATVSDDGRRVVSNPGSGVFKSGWHGCVPPPPPPGDACSPGGCLRCENKSLNGLLTKQLVPKCGECEDCQGTRCVPKKINDIIIRVNGRINRDRVAKGQETSYSAQAVANCEEYTYEWTFPGGVKKTGNLVGHTFEEIGSKTIFVEAKCSKPNCASAMKTKDKEVQVFDLEITDPQDNHEWAIDDTPQMPEMNAIAQIIGVNPDPSFETTFTWNFNVRSMFGMCPGGSTESYDFDSNDLQELGPAIQLMIPDRLIGGHVELKVRAEVDGVEDDDELEGVKIVGTNPQQADVSAVLNNDDLRRISCQESRQRQFNAAANGGTSVCPLFNMGAGDGGVGIMQVTFRPSEADHWNWRTNIATALGYFETAGRRARNHPGNVRGNAQYMTAVQTLNNYRMHVLSLPPLNITVHDFGAEQLRRGGIRCFNGCPRNTGQFGLDWHEYRLEMLGPLLRLENVNEAAGTADAVWETVPTAERPNVGDPDYVNHVINAPTTCP